MLENKEYYNQFSAKLIAYTNLCESVAERELGNRGMAGSCDYSSNGGKAVSPHMCSCFMPVLYGFLLPKGARDCCAFVADSISLRKR